MMNGRLGLCACFLLLISQQVYSQDACNLEDISNVLGRSDMLSDEGILSELLTPGGESGAQTTVRIIETNIVCEAQHEMEDRYRYTSVVVSFNCLTTDTRVPECLDTSGSVVNTQQFDFGCSGGTWTTNILSISTSARTANPIATLTTEPDAGCILCINPASPVVGSRVVSDVTHCQACSACTMGLQRCYYNATFSEVCCNFFYQGVCVEECPSGYAPNPDFECEMQCDELTDQNGVFSYTDNRLAGSTATLTCNTGYEVSTPAATCSLPGPSWSSPTPTCTLIRCNDVSPLENGFMSYTDLSLSFNSQVMYDCHDKFVLVGPSVRTCTADKTWNPDMEPSCSPCNKEVPNCMQCKNDDDKVVCELCEDNLPLEDGKCQASTTAAPASSTCDIACIIGIVLAVIAVIVIATVVTVVAFVLYKYLNDPATKLAKTDTGGLNGVARDNPLYLDPAAVTEDGIDGVPTETTPLEA